MRTENGILTSVPGEVIAGAAQQLPRACEGEKEQPIRKVLVTGVRDLGSVGITYELSSYRHGRSRFWHWRAVRADLAEPQ